MRLQFKFGESAGAAERSQVVDRLQDLGATEARPMFPDEADAELASLWAVDGVTADVSAAALELLRDEPAVEFAEAAPRRDLTR